MNRILLGFFCNTTHISKCGIICRRSVCNTRKVDYSSNTEHISRYGDTQMYDPEDETIEYLTMMAEKHATSQNNIQKENIDNETNEYLAMMAKKHSKGS